MIPPPTTTTRACDGTGGDDEVIGDDEEERALADAPEAQGAFRVVMSLGHFSFRVVTGLGREHCRARAIDAAQSGERIEVRSIIYNICKEKQLFD